MNRYFAIVGDAFRQHPDIDIQLPVRGTKNACAYDFFAPEDIKILPMESKMIWTDVKATMEENEVLVLNVRSSMGKYPVMIANTQGWVDSDYFENPWNDGNIGIRLFNLGKETYYIKKGDKIGQGMFLNFLVSNNGNVDTERVGGFGSTGK